MLQLEAASGSTFGALNLGLDYYCKACTCRRRRRSGRKLAAACGTRACSLHGTRNMQLAGSHAVANKPAEAALCLESRASVWTRVYHPNMPDLVRTFCAQSRPILILDQRQLEVGWAWLARAMRLAPTMSRDFSRSNARGRSDLHSPKDVRTSQTLVGQFDAARMQRRRRSARTASSVCAAATVACGLDSTATGSPRHGTGGRRITEAIFPRCSRSVTHGSDLDRLLY